MEAFVRKGISADPLPGLLVNRKPKRLVPVRTWAETALISAFTGAGSLASNKAGAFLL